MLFQRLTLLLVLLAPALVQAAEPGSGGHADPVGPVLLQLAAMLLLAKLGGAIAIRFRQPAVLGELLAGVVAANALLLTGHPAESAAAQPDLVGAWGRFVTDALAHGGPVDILARLGVVLLLFMVGLESNLEAMMQVGLSSLLVAVVGVAAPFFLGLVTSYYLLPGSHDLMVHVFIGATLAATSVGITARVLRELGRLDQSESRIILGAAVLDDVMGLVVLAVVAGSINAKAAGGALDLLGVVRIAGLALLFLVFAVLLGQRFSPLIFTRTARWPGEGVLLATALVVCFVLAGVANLIGLAPIVGAFAAGLLLDRAHYEDFRHRGEKHDVEELVEPLAAFLVPVFFVQMGLTVRLETFVAPGVVGFALVLTVAAILGKQVCGLAVVERGLDRMSVGVGMVPRGEVGLIFASIGRSLWLEGEPVISSAANSAVVMMVILTTLITPPVLQWTLARGDRLRAGAERSSAAATVDHETPGRAPE